MVEELIKILRFLAQSSRGCTPDEVVLHTNTPYVMLLLEILRDKGFVWIVPATDKLSQTSHKYKITSKGRKHVVELRACEAKMPLSVLEESMVDYDLSINRALR